ncbi:MAG: hypothetical protein MK105_04730 [Crocinitomicaceae bacterium]|nr:hypothetical protein [Crocinitomicaceae bacterium]
MHLNKIKASSIAEVVIAMSIIALCFGIASIVLMRTTMVMDNFQELKTQSELHALIWESLIEDQTVNWTDEITVSEHEQQNGLESIMFYSASGKVIWEQEFLGDDD